ncbi:MAG TPA: antitoxin MazE family protein [Rhizomicrobium sp.]|jgi:hypothetical protein
MPQRTAASKVQRHRENLRLKGLRPFQIWVPDTNAPTFAKEAHRQSLAVARAPDTAADQDFIESISEWPPM